MSHQDNPAPWGLGKAAGSPATCPTSALRLSSRWGNRPGSSMSSHGGTQGPWGHRSRGLGWRPRPSRLAQELYPHPRPRAPASTHSRISSMIFCFSSISSRSLDSCFWCASRWLSICCSSAFCKPGQEKCVIRSLALSPHGDKSWIASTFCPMPLGYQTPTLGPPEPPCFTETTKPKERYKTEWLLRANSPIH